LARKSKKIKAPKKPRREYSVLFDKADGELVERSIFAVSRDQAILIGRRHMKDTSLSFIRVLNDITDDGPCLPIFPGMDEPVELPPARPRPAEPYVGGAGQFAFKKKVRGGERWLVFCAKSKKKNGHKCDDLPLFKNAAATGDKPADRCCDKPPLPRWNDEEIIALFTDLPLCAECGLIDSLVASGQLVCPNCG